ncbi:MULTISPECIES: hypothetical protein [Cyanophyceae]|uniref:DUF3299 domain-containing protein n=1 Tax=Leptolyngbya subtilissima DQ-A4 TaxID=2933933 RepID=A0ABV0KCE1_9CYAN|nr:hypothetical protein [Nodosilinea sp. FACHB-141]MBD2114970.1 hypothetical protein [Nodosilinea sp. FACHB-141]
MKRVLRAKPLPVSLVMLVALAIWLWPRPSQMDWRLAQEVAPLPLLSQMMQDNLSPTFPVDPGQMQMCKVQVAGQRQPLYLVDSRVEGREMQPLCGAIGCAFFAYIPQNTDFQRVLATYLNPHVPPGRSLIEPTITVEHGLPRLVVNQLSAEGLQQYTLGFNGQAYEIQQIDTLAGS